eukprot:7850680-Pyramimonas_sp.AAC.2
MLATDLSELSLICSSACSFHPLNIKFISATFVKKLLLLGPKLGTPQVAHSITFGLKQIEQLSSSAHIAGCGCGAALTFSIGGVAHPMVVDPDWACEDVAPDGRAAGDGRLLAPAGLAGGYALSL